MSRQDCGNCFSQNHRIGTFSEWAPIQSPRAGWAVRHTLIAIAALTVLAVGLHWWRTREPPSASGIPPAISFHCNSGSVASLVFSPKGDELFVTSGESVDVYDPATGNKKRSWTTGIDWITHLALSADGSVAMTVGYPSSTGTLNGIAKAWDLSNKEGVPRELSRITKRGTRAGAAALSPDGTHLALAWQPMGATVGNNINVFDVSSGTEKFACIGHTNMVGVLTFSPDGKTLASVAWDNTIRQWDLQTGQESSNWQLATSASAAFRGMGHELLTYSADGKSLAVGDDLWGIGLEIRDAATGAVLATAPLQSHDVQAIAFSPDGTMVAAAGNIYSGSVSFFEALFGGGPEGTAGIWDAATGKPLVSLQKNGPGVQSLAFSPDGKWIAVGDQNGVVSIWDVAEVLAHEQP